MTSHSNQLKRRSEFDDASIAGDKLQLCSTPLRITLLGEEDTFVNVKWSILHNALEKVSTKWEFVAFGVDHKSAIISSSDQEATVSLLAVDSVGFPDTPHSIVIEELKTAGKRGIIFNKFLIPLLDEEIFNSLSSQGVSEIFRIKKLDSAGVQAYTGSIILIFDCEQLPTCVLVDKVKISVNALAPKPMICSHCGLLGHTNRRCKKIDTSTCKICFYSHSALQDCNRTCKNCRGDHFSNDRSCMEFKKEVKVLKIKEHHNINYFDARAIAQNSMENTLLDDSCRKEQILNELKGKINENTNLIEQLRLEREEKGAIYKDLLDAEQKVKNFDEVVIPNMKAVFENYKKDSDKKFNDLQIMLDAEIERSKHEISKISESNVLASDKYKSLQNKHKSLCDKYNSVSGFMSDFCKSAPTITKAFVNYCKKNEQDPYMLNDSAEDVLSMVH